MKYEKPVIMNMNDTGDSTPEPRGAATVFFVAGILWIIFINVNLVSKPPASCCGGSYLYG